MLSVTLVLLLFESTSALTRWSSIQFVPDADFVGAGALIIGSQGYYYSDVEKGTTVMPMGFINLGITEWVNIEAGYTGAPNVGLKARILGETRPWMPSLALGARNIFSHREAYLFDRTTDSLGSEFYMVIAKSLDAIRLRFNAGVQSIPESDDEKACPFFALEKYFGAGLYVSIEGFYREKEIHPCVFTSWRFLKRKLELSAGIVDVTGMFVARDNVSPNSPFFKSSDSRFVRPGIWAGLRFNGTFKFGKAGGFTGIENSLNDQSASINTLRTEVDSLKQLLKRSSSSIETLNRTMLQMSDSTRSDREKYKLVAEEKLALLNTLYSAEPFDPDAVNSAMSVLIAGRDAILPSLYDIIIDPVKETRIRALAISAVGEIGSQAAADIIIGLLGQSTVPEITIECLIALGKMKDTRAVYLMQQLSNDPNDDVAFTAAEVLQKLEKETGVSIAPVANPRSEPASVPEKPIGGESTVKNEQQMSEPVKAPPLPPAEPAPTAKSQEKSIPSPVKAAPITAVEKPEFQETTVVKSVAPDDSAANLSDENSVNTIPEASMKPQPVESNAVEVVTPMKTQPENTSGTAEKTVAQPPQDKTPPEKSGTAEAKPAKKKKTKKAIDTSSDTW